MEPKEEYCCVFCRCTKSQVTILISGGPDQNICICNLCVEKCQEYINKLVDPQTNEVIPTAVVSNNPSPKEIKNFLDQYIVGQDDAKITVAVAAYNHYKRLTHPEVDGVELEKSNILLIGPTGSGKTLIAQSLARSLNVPWVIADATSLTEAGYIGEDVEGIIGRLIANADYDVSLAERGIVFLDEIDKKRVTKSAGMTRDISGEGVQQALLKVIEGTELMVTPPGRKERVKIDTKNILFIVSGAFVGLDKIIKKDRPKIGFGANAINEEPISLNITMTEHLIEFGIIPELIGRLPVIAVLNDLTEDQLCLILTQPKNAVTRQFKAMFKIDGVELEFTDDALHEIARKAITNKTGARGLRGLIEKSLTNTQFGLPDMANRGVKRVVVNAEVISDGKEPEILFHKS